MIKHYRNVFDPTGWVAMFLEWGALWLIAADDKVPSLLSASPRCACLALLSLSGKATISVQCGCRICCQESNAQAASCNAALLCRALSIVILISWHGALPAYTLA